MGLFALMTAVGCTLGPEATRPSTALDDAEAYAQQPDEGGATELPDVAAWWERLDSPTLNRLVETALEENRNLAAASARVLESEAAFRAAWGARLPAVEAAFSRTRSQSTFEFQADRFSTLNTTYDLAVNVTWQADLFGRLKRSQQEAGFRLLATEADLHALSHTVVARVVRGWARVATQQRAVALAQELIDSQRRTLELTEARSDAGIASGVDVRLARENLAAARARKPAERAELAAARHALDVLLGQRPGTGEMVGRDRAPAPPRELPETGLPITLLDRRPDLRASELRLAAETMGIGVAMADLYPDLTINASTGYEASELNDLIDAQSWVWNLVTEAAVKLFQGGALRANVDAAEFNARAVTAEYQQTVLEAVREVEDALAREREIRQQYNHLRTRVVEARAAEDLAQQRYRTGVESLLSVLEAERRRTEAEFAVLDAEQALWDTRVDLYLALGGDWHAQRTPLPEDDRPDQDVTKPEREAAAATEAQADRNSNS